MEITGRIKHVSEVQEGTTDKGAWAKRTIVITENVGQYPNELVLTLFKNGDNVDYAKDKFTYKVDDLVKIEYNTRANEHKGKWYGDNSIWKIEKAGETARVVEESKDDLPF